MIIFEMIFLVTGEPIYHLNLWPSHSKIHSNPSRPLCRTRTLFSGSCNIITFSLLADDSDCVSARTEYVSEKEVEQQRGINALK